MATLEQLISSPDFKNRLNEAKNYFANGFSERSDKPLKVNEVKSIYGKKGGLRLVYELCTNDVDGEYKKVCEKIKTKYSSFKVESKAAHIRDFLCGHSAFGLLGANSDAKEAYFGVSDDFHAVVKQPYEKIFLPLRNKINELKKLEKDLQERSKTFLGQTEVLGLKTVAALLGDYAKGTNELVNSAKNLISKEKDMEDFLKSDQGKNFKQSLEALCKRIDNIRIGQKKYEEIYQENEDYNRFLNECGELAYNYLKNHYNSYLSFIKSKSEGYKLKLYEIFFMALICVCSLERDYKKYGLDVYYAIKQFV